MAKPMMVLAVNKIKFFEKFVSNLWVWVNPTRQ